jgi:hypothetical protein
MNVHKSLTSTSTAYTDTRTIKLAPLACPYCHHGLQAHDVEPLGDGEVRIVCSACHLDLLTIEG